MNYGEKIARLRKTKGMTQEELGKVLNVTYQAVSKWERGESLPDFTMMSHIAKFFQVPLGYFEDGGEEIAEAASVEATSVANDYIGVCTECGKMLKEDEAYSTSPKILCKSCAEAKKRKELLKKQEMERNAKQAAKILHGGGVDAKLIISLILSAACFVLFSVLVFTARPDDRDFYAALMLIVALAVFGCTHAVFDLIAELRMKFDEPDGYTRNLSLIVGAAFSVICFVLYLVMYLALGKNSFYLVLLGLGVVIPFTFISQFMWGSVIKEVFTCGGFTFKLPGFIFSLTPESILWMIVVKVVLGILSVFIFIFTTLLFALIAMFGSVITFIPCVIYKTAKDKKVKI